LLFLFSWAGLPSPAFFGFLTCQVLSPLKFICKGFEAGGVSLLAISSHLPPALFKGPHRPFPPSPRTFFWVVYVCGPEISPPFPTSMRRPFGSLFCFFWLAGGMFLLEAFFCHCGSCSGTPPPFLCWDLYLFLEPSFF